MSHEGLRPFSPTDAALFFSRHDPNDLRLGDLARPLSAAGPESIVKGLSAAPTSVGGSVQDFVIAGYPDDEGIRTNGGRIGASLGPDTVRKYLYKMTPALLSENDARTFRLHDIGNLDLAPTLLERHARVQEMVQTTLEQGGVWVGVGGGHDYGYPDAAGYIEYARSINERPLILNFDAHLDVRPVDRGLSSGTPFFRMLEKYPDVDFAEIGIQTQCNSRAHLQWAQSKGARVITQEEILVSGQSFATQVLSLLGDWILKPRSVFLSIDIDGFSSSAAPGCSQSWSTGFLPYEFFQLMATLLPRLRVKVLGIYEVSPPLDRDDHTSKLAAQIIHRVIST